MIEEPREGLKSLSWLNHLKKIPKPESQLDIHRATNEQHLFFFLAGVGKGLEGI